jgi:transporter family-2 protein
MNQSSFAVLAALVGGVFLAVQPPTNAMLARGLGSTVNAAFVSFAIGALILGLLAALLGNRPEAGAVKALPIWAWMGGVYGSVFVFAIAFGAPRIGVGATLILAIATQLATAVVIDQLGLLGLAPRPFDAVKLLGVALVFVGAVLVRRG